MRRAGKAAIITEISSVTVHSRTAWAKAFVSKSPSLVRKRMRLSEARLHAVSSRNRYSEHGFEARIGAASAQVCQSLIVVSNCTPGSAEAQAAQATLSHRSRAGTVRSARLSTRPLSCHSPSASTARRKASLTRTVLFEFWPETV